MNFSISNLLSPSNLPKFPLFTFIVAYRHRIDRYQNLRRVLEYVARFNGAEIILVEQDKTPKLNTSSISRIKYIFTKSELPFNKSWAFNVGLKHSTTNVIVFGDCDLIMDPNEFIQGLNHISQYDCVSPYNRVIDLLPNETNLDLDNLKKITRPGRGETDIQKICISGGIIMYRKDAILKIGGWCEDFIGWGGEDDYQSFKTKQLLNWTELPYKCYHLWHERGVPDQNFYNRNLQLLNQLVVAPKEKTVEMINRSLNKIGFKNKYDK